jgi:hypothetical protein
MCSRFGHIIGHAPVFVVPYFTLKRGSEATESSNHSIEIGQDEINVYGRPMPPEIAPHRCRAKLCHGQAVCEEEDRQISAHKLHPNAGSLSAAP